MIEALSKAIPDTKAARFGLRYINEIDLPLNDPTRWGDFIDPQLLGSRDFFEAGDSTLTTFL